ncbi:G2/M phase-specific E3 ubiquitin-protein ligase, partial [Apaloderma vittatum]
CACTNTGATIGCSHEGGCDLKVRLPCAAEGKRVTRYFAQYRAFCSNQSPRQTVAAAPESRTSCLICLEAVDAILCFRRMVCPMCQHTWFHWACIQGQALHACTSTFTCPLCWDKVAFQFKMLHMGIRVPRR